MLDPLPPDIRFERLLPDPEGLAFSFAAKEALGPHIRARWPWGETIKTRYIGSALPKSLSSKSGGKPMRSEPQRFCSDARDGHSCPS
jgi:hypothetical protein